jgi:hypothetical protein
MPNAERQMPNKDLTKVMRLDFILSHFWKQKNLIVSTFVPNTIRRSNPETRRRFERSRLA